MGALEPTQTACIIPARLGMCREACSSQCKVSCADTGSGVGPLALGRCPGKSHLCRPSPGAFGGRRKMGGRQHRAGRGQRKGGLIGGAAQGRNAAIRPHPTLAPKACGPNPGPSTALRLAQSRAAPSARLGLSPGQGKHSHCPMVSSSAVFTCAWIQRRSASLPLPAQVRIVQ